MAAEVYRTKDVNQIAVLLAFRFDLETIDRERGVCWFTFKNSSDLKKKIDDFMVGSLMINAHDMADAYRRAKDLIFSEARARNVG